MSDNELRTDDSLPQATRREAPRLLERVLRPIASLKLTVVLFAMGIFIVLAGTLAQVNADVWDVVDEYFRVKPAQLQGSPKDVVRALFVKIPSQIFFPEAFFPSRPADKFRYKLPENWTEIPPGPMQKAQFEVAGDEPRLNVSVSVAGGSVVDNINRWRRQIDLPPANEDEVLASAKQLSIDGMPADYFVIDGAKESILGAVVQRGNSTWFFKARGPKDIAAREVANFEKFSESISFPHWPGIWFPKGWLIGGVMLLNLLSAHLIRFKLQASGARLILGLWLMVVGAIVTWLVIVSGSNQDGFQSDTLISYKHLWTALNWGLLGLAAGCGWLGMRTPPEHRMERWTAFGASAGLFALFGIALYGGDVLADSNASMRILYQLVKGGVAGVVLLAGCLVLFRKRAGIVLLHGGVALLMISEVLVGVGAVESRMMMFEGETKNSMFDLRRSELAVVDASDPKVDTVTVVPLALLTEKGTTVSDERLPFDIEVVQHMKNAIIPEADKPKPGNPATQGSGLVHQAEERSANVGVSSEGGVDSPALYARFKEKGTGRDLGVWLTHFTLRPQTVEVAGKKYEIELRFEESYLPYSLKLLDVRKDDYIGTNTPRNYSSTVVLEDPEQKTHQEVTIWMNNPLRYRGLTFYQSDYGRDGTRERTTFQVVNNSGWMIPYVSCMIVGVGMFYQFVLTLMRFLNRWDRTSLPRAEATGDTAAATSAAPLSKKQARRLERDHLEQRSFNWGKWLPLAICLVSAVYILSKTREPKTRAGEMDLKAFGALPVAYEGRIKPLDTLARNTLLMISGKQEYRDGENRKQPAIRWLLDLISRRPEAAEAKVLRITNLEVLKLLHLEPRSGYLYSHKELEEHMPTLRREISAAERVPEESRTLFQRGLIETGRTLSRQDMLEVAFIPQFPDLPTEEEFKTNPADARERTTSALKASVEFATRIEQAGVPLVVPIPETDLDQDKSTQPMDPLAAGKQGLWHPLSTALLRAYLTRQLSENEPLPQTLLVQRTLSAYNDGDAGKFNTAVQEYRNWLSKQSMPELDLKTVRFEQFFNHFAPFYWSMVLCLFVFLLSAFGWLGFSEPLRRSAFWLMLLTFAVHTFALIARIYISGRPPVTNLYSTGIFIGWAVVLFGLVCEKLYPLGVGNAVASMAGFITLGISHFLSEGGDTFTVLQAVLDTQFWLATHVVTINLGYAGTAAAGLFGVYYIVYSLLARNVDPDVQKAVTRMEYGSVCYAMLFSFIGTVLGGLWADDSWGRFWGWDPKENGALIIVLWNCLVLHAKWDGMIRDRGMAVLSTLGIIAVSWSWFGTNQLGTGLHAYGFTDAARIGLLVCWSTSLAIALVGAFVPHRRTMGSGEARPG